MPTLFGRPEPVQSENEALRVTISELRSVCASLRGGDPHAQVEARRVLSDFSAELTTYFDAEEGDAYFRTLVEDCPRLKVGIARLEAAHGDLRDSVATLRHLARGDDGGSVLAKRIGRVVAEFRAHELAENSLLQDFFMQDDGGEGE